MKITLATHYGMCFGVRDALRAAQNLADTKPITILGELVHNPVVQADLKRRGAELGDLARPGMADTETVVITAHGASDRDRSAWSGAGYVVRDTTCPLVRKAHNALALLVAEGYHPVIIGQAGHAEVSGLAGDFPQAEIVLDEAAICGLSVHARIGIVSQTTQPIAKVQWLVSRIQEQFPQSEVVYKDTVCQPTKDRQAALESLCRVNEVIIVVGGKHSNNTRQLSLTVERLGATAYQIERASELQTLWFQGVQRVGVTAGTSTLQETVHEVVQALERIASS